MTFKDESKLQRLRAAFGLNYRLSELCALYLERCPELITGQMMREICADGYLTQKEALVALIAEAFGLDDSRGGEDRRIIRDYLPRMVRVLDPKEYVENPYYKKVAPREAKIGDWEIRWERYAAYRAAVCDDMQSFGEFGEYAPLGFFTEDFTFPAVLEGGNEWMTLTPVDVDTVKKAINDARGQVITFGLGLGYYTYMVSEKPEVTSVTVVERSENVISLFNEHILPRFEHREKVRVVKADAFEYARDVMPSEGYDYAFVDTWRDASDGLPMYERMKELEHLSPKTEFSYWIENFILSRRRSLRYAELIEAIDSGREDAPKTYDELIRRLG